MNLAAIIVGILAACLTPVMVVVVTAMGALLNLVQLVHTRARIVRKRLKSSDARFRKDDAEVVEMPEGRGGSVDEFPPAA